MTFHRHALLIISLALTSINATAGATVSSVVTSVACKTIKPAAKKPGKKGARAKPAPPPHVVCPDVAGFRLQVVSQQGRSTVNIIAPDRRVFALNYWDVTSVGNKAEWRVKREEGRTVPIGLIIPVNAVHASDSGQGKPVPLLAVAKVGKHTACVVKQIDVQAPGALDQARQHADGLAEICIQRPALAKHTP